MGTMKVMCVTKDYIGKWSSFSTHELLTIGKWYDVVGEQTDYFTIIWNNGYEANLSKSYFMTQEQLRGEVLDKILD